MSKFWEDFFAAATGNYGKLVEARKAKARAEQELRGLIAIAARRAYQNNRTANAQVGRDVQYRDGDLEVLVKNDYHRDTDCYVTDIIIKPLGPGWHGSHQHVIIDGDGNEIMNEWREK